MTVTEEKPTPADVAARRRPAKRTTVKEAPDQDQLDQEGETSEGEAQEGEAPEQEQEDPEPAAGDDDVDAPQEDAPVVAPVAATAPLEAPAPPKVTPLTSNLLAPGEAASVAAERAGERILDNATSEPPAVEGLFVPVVEGGTLYLCTKRLLRETYASYHHKTLVLLIAQGAQVSKETVDRITGLLERGA